MNVSAPSSDAAPMRNYGTGPKRCRGTTLSPGNSITRSIAVAWLVSLMPFIFFGCGSLFFIPFFSLKSQTCSRGLIFYEQCCGLSTCVFALDEPDSIGPRGSGSQPVRVDFHFFVRFLGICGESACVSYLPVGRPSHPWRGV